MKWLNVLEVDINKRCKIGKRCKMYATKANKTHASTTVIIIIIISNILVLHLLNEICKHCKPLCCHYATHFSLCTSFNPILSFFARKASCLWQWSTILPYLYPCFFLNIFHTGNGSKWDSINACLGPAATWRLSWSAAPGSRRRCWVLPSQVLQ